MISKIYKVTCDNCGCVINHYFDYVPSNKEIRNDGGYVKINNGKKQILCNDCYNKLLKIKLK